MAVLLKGPSAGFIVKLSLGLDYRTTINYTSMADIFRVETSESLQATNGTPKRRIVCSSCQKKKCKVSFPFPFESYDF